MLSLFDLGRIKQAYVDCGTVAGAARATGVSRKAIAAAIARNYKPLVRKTHRNRSIVELRTKISRLAQKQSQKQHRKWPTHSSARQIQQALQAETGKVISVRSTQRHLRKKGLKPLVRKALPTRKRCELAKKKEFARKHQNIRWKEIVFTDESWVCCNERTGRIQWAKRVEEKRKPAGTFPPSWSGVQWATISKASSSFSRVRFPKTGSYDSFVWMRAATFDGA